jgi:hypothetical protein
MGVQDTDEKITALEEPVTLLLCPTQIPNGLAYN